jgi:polyhydroxybutyrate depolymerase
MVLQQRPYRIVVPNSYDGSKPVPFLLLLHGYTLDGVSVDTYLGMSAVAQAKGFILATPDGLKDSVGMRYWNATDHCCTTLAIPPLPDDSSYLLAILDDVRLKYNIDPKRVFVSGHSNGGFMSHRMACDHASRIAAIVSFAGAQWADLSHCQPSEHVAVAEVHGDQDIVVSYTGGFDYPGAVQTTNDWSMLDGCSGTKTSAGADLDLTPDIAGAETKREMFTGCPSGIDVELWTIQGGQHVPTLYTTFAESIWDFMAAHPKP